ncbi:tetratricopeptide repeat protein [candidate division KSB1 bacterium]|nr:tetratricopeptide repeat protein [candidate division KSB1 bacterium]
MKTKLSYLGLGLIWLWGSCAYYNTFYNAEQAYKKAVQERERRLENLQKNRSTTGGPEQNRPGAVELQNFDKAIEKASKVLQLHPKSKYVDNALMLVGKSFYYKEDNLKAVRKFQELLENYPESKFAPEAQFWLAQSYLQMQNYEEAEKSFQDIISSKVPHEIKDEALLAIGELYYVKADYITAAHEYQSAVKAMKGKDKRAKAAFRMGECYLTLKDYEKAIDAFDQAVRYSTDTQTEDNALFQLAMCQKKLNQYDEAMNYLQKLLGRDSYEENWPIAKIEMAQCIYQKGKIEQAMDWYDAIIQDRLNPGRPELTQSYSDGAALAYFYMAEIYKNNYAQYDSAYANYLRVRNQSARSIMVDSAQSRADNIIELLSLAEVVKKQEFALKNKDKAYDSNLDLDLEKMDESTMDDSTRFRLHKTRALRRLKKWIFEHPLVALPDTLVADSLFADSLRLVDSLWVKTDSRNRNARDAYYDQYTNREFQENESSEERQLRQKKETLANKLLPKIAALEKNNLTQNKILLAEEYLFQFNQYDSALAQYSQILAAFSDSTLEKVKPQIFYTMSYIYEHLLKNQAKADSLFKILADTYPQSIHGKHAREKLNLVQVEATSNLALEAFHQAEKVYLDEQNPENALALYQKVLEAYPASEYAAKSLFAAAWINDHVLEQNQQAFNLYTELTQKYADTQYGKQAKKKLEAFKQEQEKLRQLAKADSLKALRQDSLLAATDSTGQHQQTTPPDSATLAANLNKNVTGDSTQVPPAAATLPRPEEHFEEGGKTILKTEPRRPSLVLFWKRESR